MVNLVSEDIETGENMKETVLPGEFFGVITALGRFPREENAIVALDATVDVFTVPEFELYAMSDSKIILDLLKTISVQTRQVHTRIAILSNPIKLSPDEALFGIGEKHLKKGRHSHAKYVFTRYLELYPNGKDADKAAKNLNLGENALEEGAEKGENFNPAKAYYNAINLIKMEKYKDALRVFTQVADSEDTEWAPKGVYEVGHCLFLLNRFEECIKHYKKMLLLNTKHPDIKDAMYYMGQACEKMDEKNLAIEWYKKVIDLPSSENDKTRAKTIQALEALGG
jgi:tetratricopeptide (TPR) repeat protein